MNYFNYFTEIEETFIRRRGRNLFLSPLDWALMENWKEREIPLRIILRAINNVFDTAEKKTKLGRNIKSLTYCRDEVESLFKDWQGSQIGKNSDRIEPSSKFGDSAIETHLESVMRKLESAAENASTPVREKIREAMTGIETLKNAGDNNEREIEKDLERWEKAIDSALTEHYSPSLLAEFKNEIENDLSKHKASMDSEAYQKTFELMLLKRLREHAEIPRLSLFYL
ncbi:MAG: hypothetical protein R2681_08100 [Pyrinomonadaceae bacterium]